jgi:hypothetical protein
MTVLDILKSVRTAFRIAFTACIRAVPWLPRLLGLPSGVIWDFPGWVERNDKRLPWIRRGWLHTFQMIRPAELIQSPRPLTMDEPIRHMYDESQFYQYPPMGVAHIRNGRLATRHGVVMEPGGGVIEDFNYYWNREPWALPVFEMLRLPKVEHKAGTYATLLSPDATTPNYYHWMAETLPRLALLEVSGLRDYRLIVPQQLTNWQIDSLTMLGFPPERCECFGDQQWQMENLLVPSLVGYPGMSQPWLLGWLRERLGIERSTHGNRKLYISRKNARYRRLINEEEIIRALQPLGFEAVFPEALTFREQVALFGEAQWIVAIHGAGLANTILAPRGTKVLEFITAEPQYISTSFYSICCALGHAYGNICVTYPQPRVPAISELRRREDWIVPVEHMLAALKKIDKG